MHLVAPWGLALQVGFLSLRVFDPAHRNYSVVNELPRAKWYPSVVTMADGSVLIIGGI